MRFLSSMYFFSISKRLCLRLCFFLTALFWCGIASSLAAKPLYISGGLGPLSGSYFNQDYLTIMYIALEKGGMKEEVSRLNAKEQEVINTYGGSPPRNINITGAEGGCPDVATLIPETSFMNGGSNVEIPKQLIRIGGRGCAVTSSSGTGLGLNALEFDFGAQYEYLPWLFFRTGFTFGYVVPVHYGLGIQYTGDTSGINTSTPIMTPLGNVNSVGVSVLANSNAVISYSGYHLKIPLLIGMNLSDDKDSTFYWAYGLTLSFASFKREVEGNMEIIIAATELMGTNDAIVIKPDYHKVTNRDVVKFAPGIITVMGARRRIQKNMFFFVELRSHTGGALTQTQGTQKQAGLSYASDTASAAALSSVFSGSVAQALQNPGAPGGGRVTNGLDLSYDSRFYFGVSYELDYELF